ncbi:hypothetical protein J3Q64DRAFT_1699818 [Phycomyces blakesleeanus]|uniref:FHA domain-containing protein n=1 Tax=Phycomyces blakesleeanus TaxID=4837 RepID=A0ABR3AXK1_PHYBL
MSPQDTPTTNGPLSARFSHILTSQPSQAVVDTSQCLGLATHSVEPKNIHVRIVPNIEDASRCVVFDIVDREFQPGTSIKIGRFTDRHTSSHMSFKSKVVSRAHCEIWSEVDGKLYIKDTRSSSGTFLNHIRLSSANHESRPTQIQDGDIVQLGIDYQGGQEEIYRSVRMRFELNRSRNPRPMSYTITAFNNLPSHHSHLTNGAKSCDDESAVLAGSHQYQHNEQQEYEYIEKETEAEENTSNADASIEECCICLCAMAPFQALFISPCAHSYHYKCIRPLLKSHPGFQCPICRTYSDLEASVAEVEELIKPKAIKTVHSHSHSHSRPRPPPLSFSSCVSSSSSSSPPSSPLTAVPVTPIVAPITTTSTTTTTNTTTTTTTTTTTATRTVVSPITPISLTTPNTANDSANNNANNTAPWQTIEPPLSILNPTYSETTSDTELVARDRRTVFIEETTDPITSQPTIHPEPPVHQDTAESEQSSSRRDTDRRMSATSLMEKIKMVFFEKRKSHRHHHHHSQSYQPNHIYSHKQQTQLQYQDQQRQQGLLNSLCQKELEE